MAFIIEGKVLITHFISVSFVRVLSCWHGTTLPELGEASLLRREEPSQASELLRSSESLFARISVFPNQ